MLSISFWEFLRAIHSAHILRKEFGYSNKMAESEYSVLYGKYGVIWDTAYTLNWTVVTSLPSASLLDRDIVMSLPSKPVNGHSKWSCLHWCSSHSSSRVPVFHDWSQSCALYEINRSEHTLLLKYLALGFVCVSKIILFGLWIPDWARFQICPFPFE